MIVRKPTWLDPQILLDVCGGDPLALEKITLALERQLPVELARAAASLARADASALRESAHKLCGMIAVASKAGSDEASALEELAACDSLEEAATMFVHVKALAEELLGGITSLSVDDLRLLAKASSGDESS